ncbi:MAG: twin transmembrane helix small protein [Nevskiales bacterium]
MTLIIIGFLLAILVALFSGLYFLVKDRGGQDSKRVVNALTWRVGLQLALIAFLVLAFFMGWLRPHGIYERPNAAPSETTPY